MIYKKNDPVSIDSEHSLKMQIVMYTVVFVVTAIGVYLSFLVCGRTMLISTDGNFDGVAQQFPIYAKIRHLLIDLFSGDFSTWSWDLGLGADIFDYFKGKLVNPLTYFIAAFPEKYLDIGYSLAVVIKEYLSGLAFLYFAHEVGVKATPKIIGAICYAFSGWVVMATLHQGSFTDTSILFPLLMVGMEKMLKRRSPILFIVIVAIYIAVNVVWAYMSAITVIIYYLVRYGYYHKRSDIKEFLKNFGFIFLCGLSGILLSSVFFISSFMSLSGANTESTIEKYALYSLKEYLTMPSGFFEYEPVTTAYSYLFVPCICILVIPLIVMNLKNKRHSAILAVAIFIASLLPITGSVFNGFSYSVGRWYYILVFFFVWAAIECLEKDNFRNKKNIIIMAAWMLSLAFWNIVVSYFILGAVGINSIYASIIGVVFGLIILMAYYVHYNKVYKATSLIIVLLLVGSIIGAANVKLYPGLSDTMYEYKKVREVYDKYSASTQRVGVDLQESDSEFFRIDQVDGLSDTRIARVQANENIYFGNRSIYTYFSSMDSSWHEYNKVLGNNSGYFDRTTSFSNDNRVAMDFLMGVKYFLGDSETKKPGASDYAPYGFDYYKTIDGVDVLKSKYNIGLGAAYTGYITESELMEYDYLEREQVLMQAAIVPDEYEDMVYDIDHLKEDKLKTEIRTVEYTIDEASLQNIDIADNTFTVYGGGGNFDVYIPEVKNSQIVIAFKNLERNKCDYEQSLILSNNEISDYKENKVRWYIEADAYKDDEKFSIIVAKDDVRKAALNRKGKAQGFSDVTDFNINLGYYDSIEGEINISIDRLGEYSFEDISIYAVPMDIYEAGAKNLESRKFQIESFEGNNILGNITVKEDSILYLSLLNDPNWEIYVDEQKAKKIEGLNISFVGVVIEEGNHQVELKYAPAWFTAGIVGTAIGLLLLIIVMIIRKRSSIIVISDEGEGE